MTMDFSAERLSYEKGQLIESDLPVHPKNLFKKWINDALEKDVVEPYAMSLATCGDDKMPSVRTVLMREITEAGEDDFGVVFYTNYDSAKGIDIQQNPNAEALFFWHDLERQVRICGQIKKISDEKSIDYFHKRPIDSQIAAWVSIPQSGVVTDRLTMEKKFDELKSQYANSRSVPKPEYWGGYELKVTEIEFWQGRANRMHDRIKYQCIDGKNGNRNWQVNRLLP